MKATSTQLAAHDAITASGAKRTQKQKIMDLFPSPSVTLTREEISAHTKIVLQSVCGRVFELISEQALAVRGSRPGASGHDQTIVGLPAAN